MKNNTQFDSHRREFLRKASTTAAIAGFASTEVGTAAGEYSALQQESVNTDPFTLGVASGDPLPDAVVLWTRLAPEPLTGDGGMPDQKVTVQWKMATDEDMTDIVASGTATAAPAFAHSVHVDVTELDPATEYYYRFETGPYHSPIGRTKTAPAPDADVSEFNFAFASCQSCSDGYFTAYQHMAEEDLNLVVHLGDYIYEGASEGSLGRAREPPRTVKNLDGYRIRHAQTKTDQHLQDAHAAFPWVVTWDDHEVANNYADEDYQNVPPEEFLERRADAYKAFFEHMPLRPSRMPHGPDLSLYRRFRFGNLVEFNVLDTRQYRDDIAESSEATDNPERTILGDEQEDWLVNGLQNSTTQWNVIANQILMASINVSKDWWDGYDADRETLLETMAQDPDLNPVVITGDIHRNYAYNLKADFSNPDSKTVGTEYVTTSITSFGDGSGVAQYGPSAAKPWQRFFNDERGYVRCTITPDQYRTDYRVVSTVMEPTATVRTIASFVTEPGNPGAQLLAEPEQEPIKIIDAQSDIPGSEGEEFDRASVTIRNTGDTAIDLSGFKLSFETLVLRVPTSEPAKRYTFGDVTLGAGETVTIRNGSGEDTQSILYTGNESNPIRTVFVANTEGVVLDEEVYSVPKQFEQAETPTTETTTTSNSDTVNATTETTPDETTPDETTQTETASTDTATETTEFKSTSEIARRTTLSGTASKPPTATETERARTSATADDESRMSGAGFGILAALAGLAWIAARRLKRR